MYSEKVLEIFKNPLHAGGLQGADGTGKYVDETSGDQIKLYFKVNENEVITDARFKTFGSVGSIVSSSVICSELIGLKVTDAEELDESAITKEIDLPESKLYSATYVINALKLAIEDYKKEKNKQEQDGRKPEKKVKNQKEKKQTNDIIEKKGNTITEKQVSKTKAAFEELFSAWED